MLLPPKNGRISMTFTNAFYIDTIFGWLLIIGTGILS
jgi:hypothetical protein